MYPFLSNPHVLTPYGLDNNECYVLLYHPYTTNVVIPMTKCYVKDSYVLKKRVRKERTYGLYLAYMVTW